MSRSKKQPYITDQQKGSTAFVKRKANRKVRAMNKKACKEVEEEKLAGGKQYRKASDSWNIRDWSFYDSKNKKAYRK